MEEFLKDEVPLGSDLKEAKAWSESPARQAGWIRDEVPAGTKVERIQSM